ncbi:nuclear transport factor 2 family protein [Streptomyces sp. NBC_01186]|uniref:nuclear transport factor 2 family protein n=1 Tax=Streptomyces sp. NBC_01186 TaxID=2903765 RepID=UPI002E15E20D|nr:nuclear transport factor 2 family protein [Streptomyces sp. NBC_01186]
MTDTATATTRATVDEFYRRLGSGELEGVLDLFAEQVDWNIYGADTVPWAGRRSTRAEVAEFLTTLPGHLEREEFEVTRLLVDGDDAVALGHMRQKVKRTGKPFASPFAFHFTVQEGRITRYHTYEDSHALAEAMSD